jgi:hypothetical protein
MADTLAGTGANTTMLHRAYMEPAMVTDTYRCEREAVVAMRDCEPHE